MAEKKAQVKAFLIVVVGLLLAIVLFYGAVAGVPYLRRKASVLPISPGDHFPVVALVGI